MKFKNGTYVRFFERLPNGNHIWQIQGEKTVCVFSPTNKSLWKIVDCVELDEDYLVEVTEQELKSLKLEAL